MTQFALLAGALVAVVIVAVWKLRPRDVDQADPASVLESPPGPVDRRPNLLDTARSECNPEFKESLAALVGRYRWRGTESPYLDELRHIVTGWTGQSAPPAPTGADGRQDTPASPMEIFVSKVTVAAGPGVVEIRLRRGSNVDVLVPRPPRDARLPFSLT
jgi:hypothetical protein